MLFSIANLTLAGLGLLLFIVYHYIVKPAFLSPLSKIPNAHFTAPFSPIWILWIRYKSKELSTIHNAHQRLGPVIRLGPSEISVNCIKGGVQTVYAGGFDRHSWYGNAFNNYGVSNMFSMGPARLHSQRKRMISNVYSKSTLQNSKALAGISEEIVRNRFLPYIRRKVDKGKALEVFTLFNAATFDYVCAYLYGLRNSSNMLQDEDLFEQFLANFEARGQFNSYWWRQEMPRVTQFLSKFGLSRLLRPSREASQFVEALNMEWMQKTEQYLLESTDEGDLAVDDVNYPTVYMQLKNGLERSQSAMKTASHPTKSDVEVECELQRCTIACELIDHLLAGFETSAISLTFLVHELSKQPRLQQELHDELLTLEPTIRTEDNGSCGDRCLPSAKQVDALPLLHAVIQETLRLHAAIPGPQPRITPASGCALGPNGEYQNIPGGVRISAQAWSLHREPEVFPEPEEWDPSRWMTIAEDHDIVEHEQRQKAMKQWSWAFSNGGRMCIGNNLAMLQMKYFTAALYSNYSTKIVDDHDFEHIDAYAAPPKSKRLLISVHPR